MFVGTRSPVSVGTLVTLRTLTTPEHQIRAKVARSVKVPPALQMVKQPGMGLEFLESGDGEKLVRDLRNARAGAEASPTEAAGGDTTDENTADEDTADIAVPTLETTEAGATDESGTARVEPSGTQTPANEAPLTATQNTEIQDEDSESIPAIGGEANLRQERWILQSRVAQLEEKVGALFADNRSLRRYADLLETTRTDLTAQIAALRTERESHVPAIPDAADEEKAAVLEALEREHARALEAQEVLQSRVVELENAAASASEEQVENLTEALQKEANLKTEVEQLRSRNIELGRQLETAFSGDGSLVEPIPEGPSTTPERATPTWGLLAAAALTGTVLGFLLRPSVGPEPISPQPEPSLSAEEIAAEPASAADVAEASQAQASPSQQTEVQTAPSDDAPPRPVQPDLGAVSPAIEEWAAAWSAQDVDTYLDAYSVDYLPPKGLDRDAWSAQRRDRVERPPSIEIGVSQLDVAEDGLGRATARFEQSYATPTYRDRVQKTLELAWEDGRWRILRESSEPI